MCKKILRILSLTLAILLVATAMIPTPVTAAATKADEIRQQIKRTYQKSRSHYGWDSFDGYCGSYIAAQIYYLGITASVVHGDGNDHFDNYCDDQYTSGGYRIRAYSAKSYSIREALNIITQNGTVNAYNILVGFQKTKTSLGKRYGHATMIHAILDGTVYFSESYDMKLNGRVYPEGAAITCSIDDFCEYYNMTTTQPDGVIHFGLKTYAEQCVMYPASAGATVLTSAELRTEPCGSGVNKNSRKLDTLNAGDQLEITGLYLNTAGEYWYEVDSGETGYVLAEQVRVDELHFDDVQVLDAFAPAIQPEGRSFHVKGTIHAQLNTIYTVRAQVHSLDGDSVTPVINVIDSVEGKRYALPDSSISKDLTFRKLPLGNYRYELAAIVGNHYVQDGQLQIGWETVSLWSSDFQVVEEVTDSNIIGFDANGGTASLNQTAVPFEQSIGTLPTAQRQGYVFLGWYTQVDGGQHITADFVPEDSMKLYAHWTSLEELQANWQNAGGCWYLYSDGLSSMGCIEVDGILYYFSAVDPLGQNLMMWVAADSV